MERKILKYESLSHQRAALVGSDDDNEVEILEIRSPTTVPSLNQQLSSLVGEVRSIEMIRKSQEAVISHLREKLKKAEDDKTRKERRLNEAASIMMEQQEALTKEGVEKVKLEKELEEEKKKRIVAEGKLAKLKECLESAEDLISEHTILPRVSNRLPKSLTKSQPGVGCKAIVDKVNKLSFNVKSKLSKWEDTQKERKCEVLRLQRKIEVLSKHLSSNNNRRQFPKEFKTSEDEGSSVSNESPTQMPRRQSVRNIKQPIRWTASADPCTDNHRDGKHYRDITKRYQGYQCICGLKFANRKKLDSHIQGFGSVYVDSDNDNEGLQDQNHGKVKDEAVKKVERISFQHGAHPSEPLKCLCGLVSVNRSSLQKHILRKRLGKKFSCKICGKLHRETRDLKTHYRTSHNLQHAVEGSGCQKCGSIFRSKRELYMHQKNPSSKLCYRG